MIRRYRSALVAALACVSLFAATICFTSDAEAAHGRSKSSHVASAKAGGKAAKVSASKATETEASISDPVARKLVEWLILRSDHNGVGSSRYLTFIAANPSWPSLTAFHRRAEAMLWNERPKPAQVLRFFEETPPQTGAGRMVLARALIVQGDIEGARAQIREAWRNSSMTAD